MKRLPITLLKLALVGGLIYWLVASGRLDFGELRIFVERPVILLGALTLWLLAFLCLGSLRWFVLLRGLGIHVTLWRALHFQMIGFFFNTAVPGSVGGDIVKAVYVIREQQETRRTPALLTVLLDRVVGLSCLFILAGVAVLLNLRFFSTDAGMAPLAVFLAVGFAGLLAGATLVFYPHAEGKDPVARLLGLRLPGFGMLTKVYEALRCYRHKPGSLILALLISCVIQGAALFYMLVITRALTGQDPDVGVFATIYAVGIMATAIPLAPGGLGVGHLAFDRLFHLAGLSGGANVFNVMILAQLALNLLGVVPYLLHRTKMPGVESLTPEFGGAGATEPG